MAIVIEPEHPGSLARAPKRVTRAERGRDDRDRLAARYGVL
jgi:hypothetical protein